MAFELRRSHCILIEIKLYNSSLRQHYVAIPTDLASPELAARCKTAWTSVNVLGGGRRALAPQTLWTAAPSAIGSGQALSLLTAYLVTLLESAARFDAKSLEHQGRRAKSCDRRLREVSADEQRKPVEQRRDPKGQRNRKKDHKACEQQNRAVECHKSFLCWAKSAKGRLTLHAQI